MEGPKLPLAPKKIHEYSEVSIPQITTVDEDKNRNEEYGGDSLASVAMN